MSRPLLFRLLYPSRGSACDSVVKTLEVDACASIVTIDIGYSTGGFLDWVVSAYLTILTLQLKRGDRSLLLLVQVLQQSLLLPASQLPKLPQLSIYLLC
jgi:hypothetical protein